MSRTWAIALASMACKQGSAGETGDTGTDDPVGACGDVSTIDVVIRGGVRDQDENRVPDAYVALEERNWAPGTIHGESETDGNGEFVLEARDLPVVEGCWGTAVQFWLVGDKGDLAGEKPMNSPIVSAYNDGTLDVDLGSFPLILY